MFCQSKQEPYYWRADMHIWFGWKTVYFDRGTRVKSARDFNAKFCKHGKQEAQVGI